MKGTIGLVDCPCCGEFHLTEEGEADLVYQDSHVTTVEEALNLARLFCGMKPATRYTESVEFSEETIRRAVVFFQVGLMPLFLARSFIARARDSGAILCEEASMILSAMSPGMLLFP